MPCKSCRRLDGIVESVAQKNCEVDAVNFDLLKIAELKIDLNIFFLCGCDLVIDYRIDDLVSAYRSVCERDERKLFSHMFERLIVFFSEEIRLQADEHIFVVMVNLRDLSVVVYEKCVLTFLLNEKVVRNLKLLIGFGGLPDRIYKMEKIMVAENEADHQKHSRKQENALSYIRILNLEAIDHNECYDRFTYRGYRIEKQRKKDIVIPFNFVQKRNGIRAGEKHEHIYESVSDKLQTDPKYRSDRRKNSPYQKSVYLFPFKKTAEKIMYRKNREDNRADIRDRGLRKIKIIHNVLSRKFMKVCSTSFCFLTLMGTFVPFDSTASPCEIFCIFPKLTIFPWCVWQNP